MQGFGRSQRGFYRYSANIAIAKDNHNEVEQNFMDIDLIFKIAAIGIIVAVLNLLLKRAERDEQAMMTTLAGLIVVLLMIVRQIGNLFETIKEVFGLY